MERLKRVAFRTCRVISWGRGRPHEAVRPEVGDGRGNRGQRERPASRLRGREGGRSWRGDFTATSLRGIRAVYSVPFQIYGERGGLVARASEYLESRQNGPRGSEEGFIISLSEDVGLGPLFRAESNVAGINGTSCKKDPAAKRDHILLIGDQPGGVPVPTSCVRVSPSVCRSRPPQEFRPRIHDDSMRRSCDRPTR
ncbi:hypothetical protein SKAU_G00047770 [Synaphobranchus kaupii]|uniref:Uncharacterized protein n=1 Tax=Synaphobranchus kaupii TaxID=118154 RepID=A0A9Q1G2F1_SYNKA|nr:hypothetical protein SKAU_G00047770 [Synaphobranchus kaupii]